MSRLPIEYLCVALCTSLVLARAPDPTGQTAPAPRPPAAPPSRFQPDAAPRGAQYWCPMHPDVRSDTGGTCPICGMTLVAIPAAEFVTYPVDLRATPTVTGARLRLAVKRPRSEAIVRRFAVVHERMMDVFIVGEDLDFFAHEHPVLQPDGVFMLDVALPHPGPYMAIAEFLPEGGTPQMFQQAFTTAGPIGRRPPPAVDVAPKVVDGIRVTLDGSRVRSGEATTLAFSIEDAGAGGAVTDLEPYLGAAAQLLIVAADLTEAIHGHPADESAPVMTFRPVLPRAGRYKLWLQIQRRGHVSTVPFVIEVS